MRLSLRILNLCLSNNFITKISTEILSGPQVHFSVQHFGEFDLHTCDVKKGWNMLGIELHKEVYVAFRPKIVT